MITWTNLTREIKCKSVNITCRANGVVLDNEDFKRKKCPPNRTKNCQPGVPLQCHVTYLEQCKTTSCAQCITTVPNDNSEKSSIHPTQRKPEMMVTSSSSPTITASVYMRPTSLSPSVECGPSLSSSVECGPMLGMAIGILLSLVAILLIGWTCITFVLIRRGCKRTTDKEG